MLQAFSDWFWNYKFWLPQGFTWDDLKSSNGITRPQLSDLYIVPALTVALLVIRYFFERYIALRFCRCIGISEASNLPEPNNLCENTYLCVTRNPDQAKIKEISASTGWTQQRVSRWFRKRRSAKKNTLLRKATETCWRFFIYLGFFVYGCYVLLRTDWFYDTRKWMEGYITSQSLTVEIKWYYFIELAFYLSLLIQHFYDTKRKDFWQQFVHHICTIILITGSYVIAHFRFGTVIMLLHDASDYWLESAKLANYAKTQRLCDVLFVIFAITFYLSRWVYFPVWVLRTFIMDNAKICGPLQSYFTFPYIFLYFCFILMILHLYWGYLIGRMVYKFTVAGKVEKDDRSGDSDGSD
ncbi:ceramide synthase 6-like [Hydractinia symbiolongicarpus]|uniref:ceramide synthase 6-like n=1 Tax=Hydractinia symbiolongicarpus TaxID=13093 RepID=UPI00254C76A8|nr:ceramide synthase 6-like [Hydractinia symbiolongicarpus]